MYVAIGFQICIIYGIVLPNKYLDYVYVSGNKQN